MGGSKLILGWRSTCVARRGWTRARESETGKRERLSERRERKGKVA